jgi:hypothetical protein
MAAPVPRSFFEGRSLAIATMHGKDSVISPQVEQRLGVRPFVPQGLDTDVLGTFTGEISREGDALATLRAKCRMAANQTGCDLVVASEGSFGPHPSLFFSQAGDELVMLADYRYDLEIVGRELTFKTNFAGSDISDAGSLMAFAERSGFPSHALILRESAGSPAPIIKGLDNGRALLQAYGEILERCGRVYAETDMRACFNPTRMASIGLATAKMVDKALTSCPACRTPGFGVTDARHGLRCSACHCPTASVLSHIYTCARCRTTEEKMYPYGRMTEDPMYCNQCNP